jgi:hypothetical protein
MEPKIYYYVHKSIRLTPVCTEWIQSKNWDPTTLHSILILASYLYLDLVSSLFP